MKRSGASDRRLLVAWFGSESGILGATRSARGAGYTILDVYTPYAVHGLDEAAGLRPSRLPWICFALGLTGAAAKLWYQIWTSATSWPVNVGGKPLASVPAFVPVTFEIMVLFAAVGTVAAFLAVSRLRPGRAPLHVYDRTTNDLFALVLVQDDAGFDARAVQALLAPHRPVRLQERIETAPPRRGEARTRRATIPVLAGGLALMASLIWLLPRTFTEPNLEFLPGMVDPVPYDPLASNPNFRDGSTLRVPPEGTVARGHAPLDSSQFDAEAVRLRGLRSVLTPDDAASYDSRAASVFETFCRPCHGPSGKGDGTIPAHGYPPPPSLDAPAAAALTDGRMFNILTFGRGNMPPLARRLQVEERWLAVHHVRKIQAAAAAAAQRASAPEPSKTKGTAE